jgi:hypothetical protein
MKTKIPFLVRGVALCLGILAPLLASAQAPSGNISTNITNPTNALWDITMVHEIKHVSFDIDNLDVVFDVDFTQNGGGKLAGAGDTTVLLALDGTNQPSFAAAYVVKGAITSVKGVGRLSFSDGATGIAFLNGADRKASVAEKMNIIIDPVTRQIVSGTFSRKASAAGLGSKTDSGAIEPESLPGELGDGSWTLSLDLQPDSKNKFTGTNNTATVSLASGMIYHFAVIGAYVGPTQQSKLVLKGVDEAKGSSLKVTLLGSQITGILGKVSGQAISVK